MAKKEDNKNKKTSDDVPNNDVAPDQADDSLIEEEKPTNQEEKAVEKTTEKAPGGDDDYLEGAKDVAEADQVEDDIVEGAQEAELVTHKSGNTFLRRLMDSNFIEYASYVIKERAIPDVDDGLKPVQRRILWSLFRMDDGKFHKVANVIGHTMQYHPHGDASIGDALVVLANKEYYIEKQGNFGNIMTGDPASAARYIECRLRPLAKEILFNNDITEFIDSYDGRNKEPVTLPAKIPSLLMLGAEGIAVGMSTKILPHNFKELIQAQVDILRKKRIEIYPDFLQGGIMDVSEYEDGNGKVTIRAKIDRDGRKLIIREIPASTTTESLIASIEKAVDKNKMKLASINDYTTDNVEIEILPMRGYDPEKALKALYTYTDCSVSISVNLMVICDGNPTQMTVTDVLKRNTEKLLEYLNRELEIELNKLNEKFHEKTLAQIFIENRIYKRIEECKTYELVLSEVHEGLKKFKKLLKRAITDEDVEKLLAIAIKRISLFDINKNKKDIDDILLQIEEVEKNLANLNNYAIKYLKGILKVYDIDLERKTEIETFDKIDRQAVALNNIIVAWDRKNCYIGTSVKSEERIKCNEYDHLLTIERSGKYKVINIPDKTFVGRLYYFSKYDKDQVYYIVYSEKKTGKFYFKKCNIGPFITDKEYKLCPKGCKLEIITTRANSLYEFKIDTKIKDKKKLVVNLSDAQERSAKARGLLLNPKKVLGCKFLGIQEEEEENEEEAQESQAAEEMEKSSDTIAESENKEVSSSKSEKVKKTKKDEKPAESSKGKKSANSEKESDNKKSEDMKKSTAPKSKKTTEKKVKANQNKKNNSKKVAKNKQGKDEEDDEWGVKQPEFGF